MEARLAIAELGASYDSSQMNFEWPMVSESTGSRRQQPQLQIDTSIDQRARAYSIESGYNRDLSATSTNASLDVPMIEITDCEAGGSPMMSPVGTPFLSFAASSRASTPDPLSMPLPLLSTAPLDQWLASDNQLNLSPTIGMSRINLSRRSSLCSNLDLDEQTLLRPEWDKQVPSSHPLRLGSLNDPTRFTLQSRYPGYAIPQPEPHVRTVLPQTPLLPTKTDAEYLCRTFFSALFPHSRILDPSKFEACLNAVYTSPSLCDTQAPISTILASTQYTFEMAKFHVFMVLSIGIRILETQFEDGHTALLDGCYCMALSQVGDVGFWSKKGGVEAAQLMLEFAKLSSILTSMNNDTGLGRLGVD